jgi:hypothetical protein
MAQTRIETVGLSAEHKSLLHQPVFCLYTKATALYPYLLQPVRALQLGYPKCKQCGVQDCPNALYQLYENR